MKTSVRWINDYLEPEADAEAQGEALTACGFPFEGAHPLEDGDVQQEIEMASNRGDCVCHAGLAREIAALTGRTFTPRDRRPRPPDHRSSRGWRWTIGNPGSARSTPPTSSPG